jgi:NAD(P)-dependent dehydrogenase (short-subunit alcohol dehydrogenase family)
MRFVLVTGAGGGLGACVSRALALSGETVFAADRDALALRALAPQRTNAPPAPGTNAPPAPGGIVSLRMDVTSPGDVARARRKIERVTDGLDGVVCCAGIFSAGPLVEADEEVMRRILDVNLLGAIRVVREFFPLLRRRVGCVVLIGSESSRCVMPFNGPYTISKSGLDAYAEALRRELMFVGGDAPSAPGGNAPSAPRGNAPGAPGVVRVSLVQPGAIRTALLEGVEAEMQRVQRRTLFAAPLARVRRILPREWSRGMQPERVARVVIRALHARQPRARYRVGNDPLRAALGMLPARVADWFIRCFM